MGLVRPLRTARAIPFLIVVCLLILPAQARYSGGTGEPNDPYRIATAADLIALGETPEDYDKHFILAADIDLDPNLPGGRVFDRALIAPDTNDTNSGFDGTYFGGLLDGNGHTISHLTITGAAYLGLFGSTGADAVIANLGLEAADVNGTGGGIGGLVGDNHGDIITSSVAGTIVGNASTGGLVGWNYGSITMSHSTGTVSRLDASPLFQRVGGLVGFNGGVVTNCHSTSTVTGLDASSPIPHGGASLGSYDYVGGLVGENCGGITNCYSTGTASGAGDVGGLVGWNFAGSITNCYSTVTISGHSDLVGGLVGSDACLGELCPSITTMSFWDIETSGQPSSDGGTGLTTAEMQTASTFLEAGWDFIGENENGTDDIWWILEGQDYPRLWWERVLGDDFEDAEMAELWMRFEPDVNKAWVVETAGRLEVRTSALASNVDAGYLSNGWRLDPSEDFSFQITFHHAKSGGGDSWAMVALLPGLDDPITRVIMFGAGGDTEEQYFFYEGSNGFSGFQDSESRTSHDGTLYVSYNAAKDELYLSHEGYDEPNAWRTIPGLLRGSGWQGEPVYVAVGGGGDRVVVGPGEVWLDDFILSEGTLVLSE